MSLEMEIDQQKEYIQSYSLKNCPHGNQGFHRIIVQLFGYAGHGKSSLINSCKYALYEREFTLYAEAGEADGGLTMERKSYPLTQVITMVDNRGCSTLSSTESGELYAQLADFLPLDQKVEWTAKYDEMIDRLKMNDSSSANIIVPVFVYSAKRDLVDTEMVEIKTILKNCRDLTGIFPIVVITHKTSGNITRLRDMFEGMGAEEIILVENYTPEDHLKTRGRHAQFLKLLHKILEDVSFLMKEKRDPTNELDGRRKFLLKFLHART